MSGYGPELEELMDRYRRRLAELVGLQKSIAEASAVSASPKQSVVVTVNGQGEITALEFQAGAYLAMSAAELAEEILTAARDAKAAIGQPLRELVQPKLPDGRRLLELVQDQVNAGRRRAAEPSGRAESDRI